MGAEDSPALFPVRVLWCSPLNLGTADCSQFCRGEDGCDYVLKDGKVNASIPHSEWFCTRLAELVSIAGPTCKILQLPDNSHVFGSRWEGGVLSKTDWLTAISAPGEFAKISGILSRIYAFDLFVHNVDRHAGNLLVRRQNTDYAVLAFDYSRAWLTHGKSLPILPMAAGENTITTQQRLAGIFGPFVEADVCDDILGRIAKISVREAKNIIDGHPSNWMPEQELSAILGWWQSANFHDRIAKIAEGIRDGSYL